MKPWSCNKNAAGLGVHTGADFPAPLGFRLVASIAGEIRHRRYGAAFGQHQFAISPDHDQPFGDGEVFYAHTRTRLPEGTRVEIGDFVAEVGDEGNVTGPHLHYEYHPDTKNVWNCSVHADPQPTIRHGRGPYVTKDIVTDKLGFAGPDGGEHPSDTVRELQERLNRIPLQGGTTLPVTGRYGPLTDAEVRKWQQQVHGEQPMAPGRSFLTPTQRTKMFPSALYTIHDTGLPPIPHPDEPDPQPDRPARLASPAAPLMLPGALWDPITNFPGLRPFTGSARKVTLHTTETSAKPNWETQQFGIPHLTVDPVTDRRWQHLPFDIAAYALAGGQHSPNSDAGLNIQIEIIGHAKDTPTWPDTAYRHLRSVLAWLSTNLDIPMVVPFPFTGPDGSGPHGAVRQPWETFQPAHGVVGHAHAPHNEHWDPGHLDTHRLLP